MRQLMACHPSDRIAEWLKSEDGAVTTDWVVLTAGIVGVALAVISSVSGGTQQHAANIGTELANRDLGVN